MKILDQFCNSQGFKTGNTYAKYEDSPRVRESENIKVWEERARASLNTNFVRGARALYNDKEEEQEARKGPNKSAANTGSQSKLDRFSQGPPQQKISESVNESINMIEDLQRKIDKLRNQSRNSTLEKLDKRESLKAGERPSIPQHMNHKPKMNKANTNSKTQGSRHFKLRVDDSADELNLTNKTTHTLNLLQSPNNRIKVRNLSHTSSQRDLKTAARPGDDADVYKKENRLLKNRLKSLLAIREVHEMNKVYAGEGMESN